MIQANCRDRFTGDDFRFITETLAHSSKTEKKALTELLCDIETRDTILDDECLFDSVIDKSRVQKISPFLYFYLVTRRAFLQNHIEGRDLADYVACMLAQFCSAKRTQTISHSHETSYRYLVDMLNDSLQTSSFQAFLLRSHIGNYALFMTGMFPDRIYYKSTYGRTSPGFDYYEKMGRSSYHWASQHKLAPKFCLEEILTELAGSFRGIRIALNQVADNFIKLDLRPPSMDKTMRQILFGSDPPAEA